MPARLLYFRWILAMTPTSSFAGRSPPHLWQPGAGQPVTWRLTQGQASLTPVERNLDNKSLLKFHGRRSDLPAWVVLGDPVHAAVGPQRLSSASGAGRGRPFDQDAHDHIGEMNLAARRPGPTRFPGGQADHGEVDIALDAVLRIDKVLKRKGWQDRTDDPFAESEPALAESWKAALLGRPIDDSVVLENKAKLRGLPRPYGPNCAQVTPAPVCAPLVRRRLLSHR